MLQKHLGKHSTISHPAELWSPLATVAASTRVRSEGAQAGRPPSQREGAPVLAWQRAAPTQRDGRQQAGVAAVGATANESKQCEHCLAHNNQPFGGRWSNPPQALTTQSGGRKRKPGLTSRLCGPSAWRRERVQGRTKEKGPSQRGWRGPCWGLVEPQ